MLQMVKIPFLVKSGQKGRHGCVKSVHVLCWVSCGCLEGVCRVFSRVSGRYLKSVWRLLGWCMESVLKLFGRCLEGFCLEGV